MSQISCNVKIDALDKIKYRTKDTKLSVYKARYLSKMALWR